MSNVLLDPISDDDSDPSTAEIIPELNNYELFDTFIISKHQTFGNQYAGMYFCRLVALRENVREQCRKKWGSGIPVVNFLKEVHAKAEVCVVGTIYKTMKLKPSVLASYMASLDLTGEQEVVALHDESDGLVLEDETGRFLLRGALAAGFFVTGMIVGLRGQLNGKGIFETDSFVFPSLPAMHLPQRANVAGSVEAIAFVSGLGFGAKSEAAFARKRQRLHDYLTTEAHAFKLKRLIVVGNITKGLQKSRNLSILKSADAYLAALAPVLPIDLMPGSEDPTGASLPQQAIPGAFFPQSRRFQSFTRVTNPYHFSCEGINFLGSSGQPVSDIAIYSECKSSLEALHKSLICRCLAPTAPDTLSCYPFGTDDPFTLTNDSRFPHVLFSAIEDMEPSGFEVEQLALREENGSVCLIIPPFSASGSLVVLRLDTLEAHQVTF